MPQHPAARPPRSDPASPPTPSPYGPQPGPPPVRDLSLNKVLAGAGAAATSAVLGSFFGAAGTVAGAALGSVASTVATVVYQRSLDRTRDTIVARIRPVADGTSPSELTLPMQRGPQGETVRMRVERVVPPTPRRRRWWVWVGATVLVFAIGLLAVTGIEWVKGSTLTSSDSGTSVGRVLGDDRAASAPTTAPSAPAGTPASEATPEPTTGPSSTAGPDESRTGSTGGNTPTTEAPGAGTSNAPEATNVPRLPNLPGVGSGG